MNSLRSRVPVLVATLAAFVVSAWVLALRLTGDQPGTVQVITNVGQSTAALFAAGACIWASRRTGQRATWLFVGTGCLFWGAGAVTWTTYEFKNLEPFPSLADIGYVGFPIFVSIGLLGLSQAPQTRVGRARAVLDGAMIAGSLFLISWAVVLGPVAGAGAESTLAKVTAIAYPVSDVVVITLVLYVVLRLRQLRQRVPLPLVLVALGLVSFSLADSAFAYLNLTESYNSGSFTDVGWVVGFTLIALAGLAHRVAVGPASPDESEEGRPLGQLLPYAAVSAALVVTGIRVYRGGFDATIAGCWALVVAALMVRQVLTLAENHSLTRHLEARVVARTAELQATGGRFRALVQHSSDVVTVIDADGVIGYQSDSVEAVFGYRPDELLGRSVYSITSAEDRATLLEELGLAAKEPFSTRVVEVDVHQASGRSRLAEVTITNLLEDENVRGLVLNTRDVSDRRALEQRLVHDAFHDTLTGLPNRSLFSDRLAHALARLTRGTEVAVLFIDLDGFKRINDSLGHAAGDEILKSVAKRLQEVLRPGDTVARFGGDEFAILLDGGGGDFGAVGVAERVGALLQGREIVHGQEVFLQASVGVAVATPDDDAESLLRGADLAMYRAKGAGSGSFVLYDPGMHESVIERVRLEGELRQAVERSQLVVHYQPTLKLDTGLLDGFEALVRWDHPEHGLLAPGAFISVAEEIGVIGEIGRFVLGEATHQAAQWRRRHPQLADVRMAVNLCAAELRQTRLVEDVATCLAESGLPAHCLVLEMTESMLMEAGEGPLEVMRSLKALGVQLAIDDFGTGYSSLSYLHRFPVDTLKIDRSFIERLSHESGDGDVVRTIIQLGRSLSMETLAEGIEDERQLAALQGAGCELGQGFHFSAPISAEDIDQHLAEWAVSGPSPLQIGEPSVAAAPTGHRVDSNVSGPSPLQIGEPAPSPSRAMAAMPAPPRSIEKPFT